MKWPMDLCNVNYGSMAAEAPDSTMHSGCLAAISSDELMKNIPYLARKAGILSVFVFCGPLLGKYAHLWMIQISKDILITF